MYVIIHSDNHIAKEINGKMKKTLVLALIVLALAMLTSCATIMSDDHQYVEIRTIPEGATIYVDGRLEGKSPVRLDLYTGIDHEVRAELDGYVTAVGEIERHVKWGYQAADFIFTGGVGNVFDFLNDNGWRLDRSVILELQEASR